MGRLKTHFRKQRLQRYANGGAVHHEPAIDLETPAGSVTVEKDSDDTSASDAFAKQIDALRQAELHVAEAAKQPQHGLTEKQQAFLDANPEMIAEPQRLGAAILKAHQQGFQPDSDAFHQTVADNWRIHHVVIGAENMASHSHQPGTVEYQQEVHRHTDKMLEDLNDDAPAAPKRAARNRAGGDYVPSMEDRMRSSSGGMASALASRDRSSGDTAVDRYWGGGDERKTGRVTLSPEQVEAAKVSGLSLQEYAAQVIRLREAKKNGDYLGQP
jgi:hypothetical protein